MHMCALVMATVLGRAEFYTTHVDIYAFGYCSTYTHVWFVYDKCFVCVDVSEVHVDNHACIRTLTMESMIRRLCLLT